FLACVAGALAGQDACRRYGGQAHAVADEQDYVAGPAFHCAALGVGGRAAAEPPLRGFTGRAFDPRHLDGRDVEGGVGGGRLVTDRGGAGGEQGGETAQGGNTHG